MTKLILVVLAASAICGIAFAQGLPGGLKDQTKSQKPGSGKAGSRSSLNSYQSISERLAQARKKQTEESHLRFKLGLMGIDPLALAAMGGAGALGGGAMGGGGAMRGHSMMSARYGMSAISKEARSLRRDMLMGYQKLGGTTGVANSLTASSGLSGSMMQSYKQGGGRLTGTTKRRMAVRSKAISDLNNRSLSPADKSLLAKLNGKGTKTPAGVTQLPPGSNPESVRGTSAQAAASNSNNLSSVYHNTTGSGAASATKKSKTGSQTGQSNQGGPPTQRSIYKVGN